jgi:hypothetical protein
MDDRTKRPLLMSAGNPAGWKLEELLDVAGRELAAKCRRMGEDRSALGLAVVGGNLRIIRLLNEARAIQLDTLAALAGAAGPDQGPGGPPRCGPGFEPRS